MAPNPPFTMRTLLSLASSALARIPDELMDPDTKQANADMLRNQLASYTHNERCPETDIESLKRMDFHAGQVYDLLKKADYPGAFINMLDMMMRSFSIVAFAQQLDDPAQREMVFAEHRRRRAAEREEQIEFLENKLALLRQGTTGPAAEDIAPEPPPERVLIAPRGSIVGALHGATDGQLRTGFYPSDSSDLAAIRPFVGFIDRDIAEEDPAFKQLIVYAVIVYNGKILCYKRGKVGGESRLHAKHSIGVGGHINEEDWNWRSNAIASNFDAALSRELREEIGVYPSHINSQAFLGFVNDEDNEVGRVHLGLVYVVELDDITGTKFEEAIVDPQWIDAESLVSYNTSVLETWSSIIFPTVLNHLRQTCVFIDNAVGSTIGVDGSSDGGEPTSGAEPSKTYVDPDADLNEPLSARQADACEGDACESCQ